MIKLSVFFEDLEADDFCSNLEITLVALRIPHALGAVSYTHLDVYKRQEIGFLSAFSNMILAFANNICIIINKL